MANNPREEPGTAPLPDRWYNLTLGPSFSHQSSNKYCTLRYEFKPASIDKSKPGKLQKTKENRVSVEFQNNQPGKPKVAFKGSSEDYKDSDAVLFFDGENFRLERLHRSVKQLRHVRQLDEPSTASVAAAPQPGLPPEPQSSPVGKSRKPIHNATSTFQAVPVEVEHIDIGGPHIPGPKFATKGPTDFSEAPSEHAPASLNLPKNDEDAEDNNHEFDMDELFGGATSDYEEDNAEHEKDNARTNVNSPHDGTDDEIADVDDCGDDEVERGQNAADALRAQLNAEGGNSEQSLSSSSSSGSGSGSRSTSSSGSEGSDDDSVTSI
ncbi:hypothetical protein SAY87_025125 [Trapa incisa]|uniref:Transcription elongation factor Eaf N-terminal domain-containing protein n=2 Tax=Trapa TaxID=22665 RepID=A0AAN7R1C2_TRANT|nr:hypothetical protein SAY87_025125 [Trapa incisa]KAK4788599.1 hypothetical protein SAY86_019918 [Trapa natans]